MSDSNNSGPDFVQTKRILLVDDEALVRDATRMLLELDHHEVSVAENGERALELYEPGLFDLVITDFRMEPMHGGELTRRIKELAPRQPVIILTAWPRDVEEYMCMPDLVVTKPYTWTELRGAVSKVLA